MTKKKSIFEGYRKKDYGGYLESGNPSYKTDPIYKNLVKMTMPTGGNTNITGGAGSSLNTGVAGRTTGSGIAGAAPAALGMAADLIPPTETGRTKVGATALKGAASGAALGTSILPGWGTAIGAVVGGVAGWIGGAGAKRRENRMLMQMENQRMAALRSNSASRIAADPGQMSGYQNTSYYRKGGALPASALGNYIRDTDPNFLEGPLQSDALDGRLVLAEGGPVGDPVKKIIDGKTLPEFEQTRIAKIDSLSKAWGVPSQTIFSKTYWNYGDSANKGGIPRRVDYSAPGHSFIDYYEGVTRGMGRNQIDTSSVYYKKAEGGKIEPPKRSMVPRGMPKDINELLERVKIDNPNLSPRKRSGSNYEPANIIQKEKAAAAVASLSPDPWVGGIGRAVSFAGDMYTGTRHLLAGDTQDAGVDFSEAFVGLIPFLKGKKGLTGASFTAAEKAANRLLQVAKVGADADNIAAGIKENGGQLSSSIYSDYLRNQAEGGTLNQLNSNTVEVDGPSHEGGGVKLPELNTEVEGKETIAGDYVFSDKLGFARIHKPLARSIGKVEKKPMSPERINSLRRLNSRVDNLKQSQEIVKNYA